MKSLYFYLLSLCCLMQVSCKKDNQNVSKNIFTIKIASGQTFTANYAINSTAPNTFSLDYNDETLDYNVINLNFFVNINQLNYAILSINESSYTVGKLYDSSISVSTTDLDPRVRFGFYTDTTMPVVSYATVIFTNYNQHGRISGVAKGYDQSGKLTLEGDFDFVAK